MKSHYLVLAAAALIIPTLSGCFRSDATATVDRGDHALVIDTGATGSFSRGGAGAGNPSGAHSGPPRDGETVIVLGVNEPLYKVADDRGLSLRWLIERNDLTRRPGPGDRIIIPDSQATFR